MKSIYTYSDFTVFIKDLLEERHGQGHELTYEEIGKRVGFTSKGFLTQIIQGKSKLPVRKIVPFANALGLKKKEREYFAVLVQYNQAKTHGEKNEFFQKLTQRFTSRIQHLGPDKYEFYTTWYYSAIRSMLSYYPFAGDYKELAAELVPAITPGQAKKAIRLLEKLSLIQKHDDGLYHITERLISSGDMIDAFAVINYQKVTMDLAKESLELFQKPERSSSTLTLGVSESGYRAIQEKLDAMRMEIMEIASYDRQIDRVVQVNLHAFPLTKSFRGSI